MTITIFTPTYNRAYILSNLYNSLVGQSDKKFVWLIIDDGSTDDTKNLVESWIKENKIKIRYYYQKNQGKSMAHNKGIKETNTELFCCVDSDDYLTNDAVELIKNQWKLIKDKNIIGMLAYRGYSDGDSITTFKKYKKTSTLNNAYRNLGLKGDTFLIYQTSIIKKYSFPNYVGENFMPEAYLYDLLDQEGELYIIPKILYIGEYLEDGYTKNMTKLLLNNPKGYLSYICQRLVFNKKIKHKILIPLDILHLV